MKKEDAALLSQLVGSMKDAISELDKFYSGKDKKGIEKSKKEILEIQKRIASIVR